MRGPRATRLIAAAAAFASVAAPAPEAGAAPADVRDALVRSLADVVNAADALRRADASAAAPLIVAAALRLRGTDSPGGPLRRIASRLASIHDSLPSPSADALPSVLSLRRVSRALNARLSRAGLRGGGTCAIVGVGAAPTVRRPGESGVFRVLASDHAAAASLAVIEDDVLREAIAGVVPLGRGRFRVTWGPDAGAATLAATCGGAAASARVVCTGPAGVLEETPPAAPDYGAAPLAARVGSEFVAAPAGSPAGAPAFTVSPPLPSGLVLDAATGGISGVPSASGPATTYRVTAANERTSASADVVLDVDPLLPAGVVDMVPGFRIDAVAQVPDIPVKMAVAPDGRIFVSELLTGRLRVIDAQGSLVAEPVATVTTQLAAEQGLFGIALAPDFETSGTLYVLASAPAGGGKPIRDRVLRYGLTGNVATSGPAVVVDDLPVGELTNGGHLLFGPDGDLYATTGDTNDPALAQADGSLAGRVLRFTTTGAAPADNPIAGSIEWCRGFRNPFGLAFDPLSHYLFASENGPAAHDELDFVEPGRNYLWGAAPDAYFGALTGVRIYDWTPVIVPTGLAVHDGTQFGPDYAHDVFLGSYDGAQVRRIVLEGIDLRTQSVFVQFSEAGIAQKPLDVVLGPDGSLWISTFATVWRVRRD